jgi:hypothetical protein
VNVASGGESALSRSSEYDSLNLRVCLEFFDRRVHFTSEVIAESVKHLGAVQPDDSHFFVSLYNDVLVAQRHLPGTPIGVP